MKVALFTDTLCDTNGVSRFLQDLSCQALRQDKPLHIYSPTIKHCPVQNERLHRFDPLARMPMPLYPQLDLALPAPKTIAKILDSYRPDIVHISTPGPTGWIVKSLAKKRRLPIVGTYHTDFPQYVFDKTGSHRIKNITERIMARFYKDFSAVLTRSSRYLPVLQSQLGLKELPVRVLQPGTDPLRFHPRHRFTMDWEAFSVPSKGLKVLYVGRLSEEKRFALLLDIWRAFQTKKIDAKLILVGEGNTKAIAAAKSLPNVIYLGKRIGKELSFLYAASDLFVTPSVTETLGQTILEAMASALPVVVASEGGHLDFVEDRFGAIVDSDDAKVWAQAIERLCRNDVSRRSCGELAYQKAHRMTIEKSFLDFWRFHEEI